MYVALQYTVPQSTGILQEEHMKNIVIELFIPSHFHRDDTSVDKTLSDWLGLT